MRAKSGTDCSGDAGQVLARREGGCIFVTVIKSHLLSNPLTLTFTAMSIKVKAVERNVSFDKNVEKWAYVMQAELYSKLSQSKVIQEAAMRSGISKGSINAAWDAIGEVIKAWATEGHSVAIPGLGSMRFGLRAPSVSDVNRVGSGLITSRRVIFTPNVDIKEELARTSVSITCYDRNGNIVKRITSTDEGNVEDPEDPTPGGGDENEGPDII